MAIQDFFARYLGNTLDVVFAPVGARLRMKDDQFVITDPTDVTKQVRFDAEGVTTATTRVITVPDFDFTVGSNVGGLRSVVSNSAAVFATPTVLTAAMSGTTQLLDVATGIDFTLPAIAAAQVGTHFRFLLTVEPTSNSYRWTGQTGDVMGGHLVVIDKDQVEGSTEAVQQLNRPDGTDLICTITGTDDTQGSLVGGWLEFEATTATQWFVRGSLIGDGALAQNFS
jgi:hypothetical protein